MRRSGLGLIPLLLLIEGPVSAQSAWLPEGGHSIVSQTYARQAYSRMWQGSADMPIPFGRISQLTYLVAMEYGLRQAVALDLTLGYTSTSSSLMDDSGTADSTFGIRWRVLDEFRSSHRYSPTLALRLGGIVQGSYDVGFASAPGDGASGAEASLLFGKTFGDATQGLYGDLGYRHRTEGVPDDVFDSIGLYKTLHERFTVSLGYRQTRARSGPDINDPGFTPAQFPTVRESTEKVEGGVGYAFRNGPYVGLNVTNVVAGDNTARKAEAALSLTFPLGGGHVSPAIEAGSRRY